MKAETVSRIENGEVRVTEWRFAVGAETGWHRHEYDSVVVPLTDGPLRWGNAIDDVQETVEEANLGRTSANQTH